jgi:hydroxymethylpyrimidine pyrophosphatase-like HAD family hydrolase
MIGMLAPDLIKDELPKDNVPLPGNGLAAEREFYEGYAWCLNPHLTVHKAIEHLRDEIGKLPKLLPGWRSDEAVTNVYLLSCGLLNCADEYLRGPGLRLPWRLATTPSGRCVRWMADNFWDVKKRRRNELRQWRDLWLGALHNFLAVAASGSATELGAFAEAGEELTSLLNTTLPRELLDDRVGIPSPFRRLDMTHHDVIALGERYVDRFPDRAQTILLVGLRTSGSYFAPLLRAFLANKGFASVSLLTLSPSKGPGRGEAKELRRYAERGYTAVIVDDPPHTGGTILTALEIARRAGFALGKLRALVPPHPARPNWFQPLSEDTVISLDPGQWQKRRLLDLKTVQQRLSEYFGGRDYTRVSLVASDRAEAMNARLQDAVSDERGTRLKRIFEVHLETQQGRKEVRYVLAKSVGWGWLGYHAFLAGTRLSGFVPPVLGLRDGILYMEWVPDSATETDRLARIDAVAAYIAARVRHLSLARETAAGLDPPRQGNGARLLREQLSKAYGPFPINMLMQPRLGGLLRGLACPFPTFIDGNMQREDWVDGAHGLLKSDYEHHGLGKEELNVIDPAYDLADTILQLELTADDESVLVRRYIDETGDAGVVHRLMLNKLLAGLWTMKRAHEQLLGKAAASDRQQALHRQFLRAWDFLTVQAARYCGRQRPTIAPRWQSPLVALDIDGVIDRRLFGFPTTTPAGVEALALLNENGHSVALNTARSVAEVKAYCEAYQLAGGVAEHGGYIWDAVNKRGRSLLSVETTAQLDELRRLLDRTPGVFLDDRHRYSIRAFSYQDKPRSMVTRVLKHIRASSIGDGIVGPVPTLLVQHLLTEHNLDRLYFHHTDIDTTIVAKEANKGTGLLALRDWILGTDAKTIAVGDQEADLWMFRAATHSFAPANIRRQREARLLGCGIVRGAYQRGLLEIARILTNTEKRSGKVTPDAVDLFLQALCAADRSRLMNLAHAVLACVFP